MIVQIDQIAAMRLILKHQADADERFAPFNTRRRRDLEVAKHLAHHDTELKEGYW